MAIFSAVFAAVAASAAQDLFELNVAATTRVLVHQIELGQYSDFGDAADELLSISFLRGFTVSGSVGGTAPTPRNLETWGRAAASTVEINNTTVANTGTPHTLYATTFNIRAGFFWPSASLALLKQPIALEAGDRFVVRMSAPADAITMNGTMIFEEIGALPG